MENRDCVVEKNYEIEGLLNRKVIIKGKFKICNISKQCLWGCCSDCLGENTFIGEEILWSSDLSYKYTVKVVSDEAKVYQILRADATSHITLRTQNALEEQHAIKERVRRKAFRNLVKQRHKVEMERHSLIMNSKREMGNKGARQVQEKLRNHYEYNQFSRSP